MNKQIEQMKYKSIFLLGFFFSLFVAIECDTICSFFLENTNDKYRFQSICPINHNDFVSWSFEFKSRYWTLNIEHAIQMVASPVQTK